MQQVRFQRDQAGDPHAVEGHGINQSAKQYVLRLQEAHEMRRFGNPHRAFAPVSCGFGFKSQDDPTVPNSFSCGKNRNQMWLLGRILILFVFLPLAALCPRRGAHPSKIDLPGQFRMTTISPKMRAERSVSACSSKT
jgi:hypothetical protein